MVKMLDEHIGILLAELEKLGILDNTIIVFASDNGHETYYNVENRCRKSPNRDMGGKSFDAWEYPYRSELTGDYLTETMGCRVKMDELGRWRTCSSSVQVALWN